MQDKKNIKSVFSIDNDLHMVYGLFINKDAAKWNSGMVSFKYFQCDFDEFIKIFGSPRTLSSREKALNNSFPMALRAILKDGSYIFERPPFQYTLHMSPKNARFTSFSKNAKYISETVWIPWSFYQITPHKINKLSSSTDQIPYTFSLFFSDQKITSNDHFFTTAPLPNVFNDGNVCLGDSGSMLFSQYREIRNDHTIKDVFNIFVNTFYSGGWNSDVLPALPIMFDYNNFRLSNTHPEYDKLQNLYYQTRKSVVPISHRDTHVKRYINGLKMWSQMSLEDVLASFNAEIYHNGRGSRYTSFDQLIPESESQYFDYFLSCDGKVFHLPPSFKSQVYYQNPIDNSVIYFDTEVTESDYYKILDNLISYYKDVFTSDTQTVHI